MFDNDKFFSAYEKASKENEGIPGFEMNMPMVNSTAVGKIGLELEIEGRNLPTEGHLEAIKSPTTNARWGGHPDGSLRGENFEYILSKPINPDELRPMIEGLYGIFEDRNTRLNCSNRCSTHVHINMFNSKINTVTSVIAMWMVFEESLVEWNGIERKTNHFCLTSNNNAGITNTWKKLLTNGMTGWPDGLKYSALNILPLRTLGSLEFRCGQAPQNPENVIMWALFLSTFVDYVVAKYKNPNDIAYDLSERGAYEIFQDICSKNEELAPFFHQVIQTSVNGVDGFNQSCMQGFRNAQPFVLGFPWEKWIPLIDREYVPNPFGEAKPKKMKNFYANLGGLRRAPIAEAFAERPTGQRFFAERPANPMRIEALEDDEAVDEAPDWPEAPPPANPREARPGETLDEYRERLRQLDNQEFAELRAAAIRHLNLNEDGE